MTSIRTSTFQRHTPGRYAIVCVFAWAIPSLSTAALAAIPPTQPSTRFVDDIQMQIDAALRQTGDLKTLAGELARTASNDPQLLAARVRVALEQGDVMAAAALLKQLNSAVPNDPATLTQLSRVQETVGEFRGAQQTLAQAAASEVDPARRVPLMLRLAAIDLEMGTPTDGAAILRDVAKLGPAQALRAGTIAHLLGAESTSLACLTASGAASIDHDLFEGNVALQAGRLPEAADAFGRALDRATTAGDRLYGQERLIATARRAGKLSQLVDEWLAATHLPRERFLPLATMLRELGRTSDLLAWWQREAALPDNGETLFARRFVNEIIGAAETAGASTQAESIAEELLKRNPQNVQWLSTVLRLVLDQRKNNEADALLIAQVDATETSSRIMTLERLASTLGRDAPALAADQKLIVRGGDDALEGRLRQALIYTRNGQRNAATATLTAAASSVTAPGAAANNVASALEAAGLGPAAVSLLQTICGDHPDNETLEHLAALLLAQHRPADALPVLQQLLRATPTPALRAQTFQQLLDAAAATNTLKALIAELTTRLSTNKGSLDDLALLADALVRSKDPKTAVAVLQATPLLTDPEKFRRSATVLLQADQFSEAYDALNRLVQADPGRAVATLQQMAVVALKANRADAAAAAIDQLKARIGVGPESLVLLGNLFSQLGRPQDAARCYRRTLAGEHDATDDWLLWSGAMAKAGDGVAAIRRLQALCDDETATDATCAAAGDGLLNLSASPDVLRCARRDLMLRLAADPSKPLLYPVLADFCEELQDSSFALRLSELAVPMSEGDRSQKIRDLMEAAGEASRTELSVECGKALLTLGDNFPPQLFLQLGERLLSAEHLDDAQRAFDRAADAASEEQVVPRAAELLARYGYYSAALGRLAPLADRHATDAQFLHEIARLEEIVGQANAAYNHCCAAFTITARQAIETKDAPGFGSVKFDPAREADGALTTARTAEQQRALLALCEAQVSRLLQESPAGAPPSAAVTTFVQTLHHACFPLHALDVANRVDDSTLQRWPTAAPLMTMMLTDRFDAGLYTEAARFATAHGMAQSEALQQATAYACPSATTIPASWTPQMAAAALPALIAHGDVTAAHAVLSAVPFEMPPPSTAVSVTRVRGGPPLPIPTLVAAASAIGEDDLGAQWTLFWLKAIEAQLVDQPASKPTSAPTTADTAGRIQQFNQIQQLRRLIATTWRSLSERNRERLADELFTWFERTEDPALKRTLADILVHMSSATHAAPALAAAECLLHTSAPTPASVAPLFLAIGANDRPAFLLKALAAVKPERRLSLLTTIVSLANEPLDAQSVAAFKTSADALVAPQMLEYSTWFANAAMADVLPTLARATARSAAPATRENAAEFIISPQPLTRLAAAAACATAGDQLQADAWARAELDQVVNILLRADDLTTKSPASSEPGTFTPDPSLLLRFGVGILSRQARVQLLGDLARAADQSFEDLSPARQAATLLVKSIVLEGVGQRAGALDALRAAVMRAPRDNSIGRAYADHLADDRRAAELVNTLGSHSASAASSGTDGQRPILDAYRELFQVGALIFRQNASGDELPPLGPDYMTPAARRDAPAVAETVRVQLERQHATRWFASGMLVADAGGLSTAPDSRAALPEIPQDFIAASVDDLQAAMLTRPVHSPFSEPRWLSVPRLLAKAASSDAALASRLNASLQAAITSGSVTTADRALIVQLALQSEQPIAPERLRELWSAAIIDDTGMGFQTLATTLRATHDPAAAAVARWADAAAQTTDFNQDRRLPLTPTPMDANVSDSDLAAAFRARLDMMPSTVETELAALRDAGRVNAQQQPRTELLWARFAAERGDLNAYRARIDSFLRALAWSQIAPKAQTGSSTSEPIDLREALPVKNETPEVRAACLRIVSESLQFFADRCPGDSMLPRSFAELGDWARLNGQNEIALTMLANALQSIQAQGLNRSALYAADLAVALGQSGQALKLQRAMLAERCLPSVRIAPVLRELIRTGAAADAARLAADAATYCREPNLAALNHRSETSEK